MNKTGLTFRFPEKAGPYTEALRAAGLDVVLLSPDSDYSLDGLSGLCLSGGLGQTKIAYYSGINLSGHQNTAFDLRIFF